MGAKLSRRDVRRADTRADIVAAAWDLVRANGFGGLAMRDLAAEVGLKAPSLYAYFDSKDAILDAMFHDGYVAFAEHVSPVLASTGDPAVDARRSIRAFFGFCTADPARYQLLFQRPVPDFEPSPASYALAVEQLDDMRSQLAEIGVTDPEAIDLWTAMTTGLVSQQLANDPGGDRWERLIDRAVDMLLLATIDQPT